MSICKSLPLILYQPGFITHHHTHSHVHKQPRSGCGIFHMALSPDDSMQPIFCHSSCHWHNRLWRQLDFGCYSLSPFAYSQEHSIMMSRGLECHTLLPMDMSSYMDIVPLTTASMEQSKMLTNHVCHFLLLVCHLPVNYLQVSRHAGVNKKGK